MSSKLTRTPVGRASESHPTRLKGRKKQKEMVSVRIPKISVGIPQNEQS